MFKFKISNLRISLYYNYDIILSPIKDENIILGLLYPGIKYYNDKNALFQGSSLKIF